MSKETKRKIIDSEIVCICLNDFQNCVTSEIRINKNNGRLSFKQKKKKKYFISFLILDIISVKLIIFQEKKKRIFTVLKCDKYLFT